MPKNAIPPLKTEASIPQPVLGCHPGGYDYRIIGLAGSLAQFGVHIEALHPGTKSSLRHWHKTKDEMVYMLSGKVVLIEEHETFLHKGDVACWPAGAATALCLENCSGAEANYLTIGTRNQTGTVHYPDHNLITHNDGGARRHCRSDGNLCPERTQK
jgi:uncharacterized cupin superfamily protein